MHESRIQQMEDWLKKKKLDEAYNLANIRDSKRQDEI